MEFSSQFYQDLGHPLWMVSQKATTQTDDKTYLRAGRREVNGLVISLNPHHDSQPLNTNHVIAAGTLSGLLCGRLRALWNESVK